MQTVQKNGVVPLNHSPSFPKHRFLLTEDIIKKNTDLLVFITGGSQKTPPIEDVAERLRQYLELSKKTDPYAVSLHTVILFLNATIEYLNKDNLVSADACFKKALPLIKNELNYEDTFNLLLTITEIKAFLVKEVNSSESIKNSSFFLNNMYEELKALYISKRNSVLEEDKISSTKL